MDGEGRAASEGSEETAWPGSAAGGRGAAGQGDRERAGVPRSARRSRAGGRRDRLSPACALETSGEGGGVTRVSVV